MVRTILDVALASLALMAAQETPEWVIRPAPTPADYPKMAADLGISGFARVQCQANAEGVPVNCISLIAKPANLGFENAAVQVVQRGRMQPDTAGGLRNFTMAVPFNTTPRSAHPEWRGPPPTPTQIASGRQRATLLSRNLRPMSQRIARLWEIERLPAEQKDAIQSWIDELSLSLVQERQDMALGAARSLATRELEAFPQAQPDDWEEWGREIQRARPFQPNDLIDEISRRYCASFDCTSGEGRDP